MQTTSSYDELRRPVAADIDRIRPLNKGYAVRRDVGAGTAARCGDGLVDGAQPCFEVSLSGVSLYLEPHRLALWHPR